MILGLSFAQFTFIHVVLSLIGIVAGCGLMFGFLKSMHLRLLTAMFFLGTAGSSLSGFFFPYRGITPAIVLGVLSVIALGLALIAQYVKEFAGKWRAVYVIAVCVAFYFNCFVLIAQAFAKVPALKALAPTMPSPAFGIAQLALLVVFVVLTPRAVKNYQPD
jgi:hypothetical protein